MHARVLDGRGQGLGAEITLAAAAATAAQDQPAVAYGAPLGTPNGAAAQTHLVVWTDDRNGNADIYGQFVAGGGALVGGAFPIAAGEEDSESAPVVAYDAPDDEFLVVWVLSLTGL